MPPLCASGGLALRLLVASLQNALPWRALVAGVGSHSHVHPLLRDNANEL
jgi:transposase